jgi:hypothetical protein
MAPGNEGTKTFEKSEDANHRPELRAKPPFQLRTREIVRQSVDDHQRLGRLGGLQGTQELDACLHLALDPELAQLDEPKNDPDENGQRLDGLECQVQ